MGGTGDDGGGSVETMISDAGDDIVALSPASLSRRRGLSCKWWISEIYRLVVIFRSRPHPIVRGELINMNEDSEI
jgi:hypothetical protein